MGGRQRSFKSKNHLSSDRIERLEALPGWSWDPFADQWEEVFKQLQSYVKEYGNAKVPFGYITQDGLKLGIWVLKQRQDKSKNKLSQERESRLAELPNWAWLRLNK